MSSTREAPVLASSPSSPPAPQGAGPAEEVSFWRSTQLIAGREISVRLRDRTFLMSTLIFLVIAAAATILPALLGGQPSSVAVTETSGVASVLERTDLDVRMVADDRAAERLVRDDEVDAAIVADDGAAGAPGRVRVLALREAPDDVLEALSVSPPVQLLDEDAVEPGLRALVPVVFGMLFFSVSVAFGVQIAQSVIEEKQTRIVEILVAAVPVRALLAGKILGALALALGQIALIAVVALVGMKVTDSGELLSLMAPAIGWFLPFFLVGFVLLAVLWAVAGSLVSRQEDIAGTSMPIQMLLMVPFFGVIFFSDEPVVMTVLSYVPFSAPMAMPLRLFFGEAAVWEPVLALVVLAVATVGCLLVASRAYEGSLLRTNGRTSLVAAFRHGADARRGR